MKASEKQLNYAREREWRNLDRIHQSDAEVVAEMHRILQRTLDNCKSQAEAWYTRYASANGITPAEAKKCASTADIEALARKAQDYVRRRKDTAYAFSEQANREMSEYNFSMKMSREELLMRYIDIELSAGTDEQNQLLGDHLSNLSTEELKRQAGLLGMRLPDHKELTDLSRTIATSSFHGETFSDRLWQNQKSLRTLLEDGIMRSILLGKNPTTWMRSLETHLRDAGNNAKYNAKRLAITESGRVQIEAQKKSYERAGYSQYVVICEPTACKICMQHDGEVYDVVDLMQGKNAPMFHPFCKCSTAAHMDRKDVDDAIAALERAEGKIIHSNHISGGTSGAITDVESDRAKKHAELRYDAIRKSKSDVEKIAKNTGYTKEQIEAIKNYLFIDKHDLGRGQLERFDPSFSIEQSWTRLASGNPEKHDLLLLKHEIFERSMVESGMDQDTAHIIATRKYNYQKGAEEFYDSLKKRKQK